MRLKDAYLCVDCDEVFTLNRASGYKCPNCGSDSYGPLQRWTGWMQDTEVERVEKEMIYEGLDNVFGRIEL